MDWTTKIAVEEVCKRGFIFNIGQLPKAVTKDLDKLVKTGFLVKEKACWPHWYFGYCKKTGWKLA